MYPPQKPFKSTFWNEDFAPVNSRATGEKRPGFVLQICHSGNGHLALEGKHPTEA